MSRFKRRKFLRLSGAAIATLLILPRARAAEVCVRPGRADANRSNAADPLLEPAIAWIGQLRQRGETHLLYPVSRLQRHFRTGYSRTCALADSLAERGAWTISFSADGTRYARIHASVPA
jgi:hypothetical protein